MIHSPPSLGVHKSNSQGFHGQQDQLFIHIIVRDIMLDADCPRSTRRKVEKKRNPKREIPSHAKPKRQARDATQLKPRDFLVDLLDLHSVCMYAR